MYKEATRHKHNYSKIEIGGVEGARETQVMLNYCITFLIVRALELN